ncbi:MAG: phosphate/phosphite/phosphonate ABC transporter substrate-binding protein [Desulfobulbaceae bacterium]|nr:phosphate/phosphite/phosphonate ABC transporter substrate-binding protein [Desulfobulbaceae bacterium]
MKDFFSNFNKLFFLICISLFVFFLFGCEKQEPEKSPKPRSYQQTIRIGLIPEQNLFAQKKRYEPLAQYLSDKIGVNIELKILSRYGNIIDNFLNKELDGAFFGSFTGALACKKLNVEPLARPENSDAKSTYYGLIFTRIDSGILSGADMKGKRFAFVDRATTAGWLLPLHYFQEQGITDHAQWFNETYFTGTHEDAIRDVLNKKADIGAAKNTVFDRMKNENPRIEKELRILALSPEVPANSLLVSKDLNNNLIVRLKEALLDMDMDIKGRDILKKFGASRFIETKMQDYRPVFDYADHIGLDLAAYDYLNN